LMQQVLGAQAVNRARLHREDWFRGILYYLDKFDESEHVVELTVGNDTGIAIFNDWQRYDFFGPVYDLCPPGRLEKYGIKDEEKYICDLDGLIELSGRCEIISVGSRGDWNWETVIYESRSDCYVHTFDCTGDFPVPPAISDRVKSYTFCIGSHSQGPLYKSYEELLDIANFTKAPTYFKMDIEGFEWNVMPDLLQAGSRLPQQIGFEIHYHRLMEELDWMRDYKHPAEIAVFGEMWYSAGYLPFHRRDNQYGTEGEATEYLMVKVDNPRHL